MTALKEFQRIETSGLWRARPEDQRREVILSFGDTSLVIKDRSDAPITHWSLSAIDRTNPGKRPAIFEPGADTGESLEIDDDIMINAIEKVRSTIDRHRPKQGRLRLTIFLGLITAIAALGFFWLPGALSRHALTVVPDTKREMIGIRLLNDLGSMAGTTCKQTLGRNALTKLHSLLDPSDHIERVVIYPSDTRDTILLPGKLLALSATLVEDFDTPDVVSGYIVSGLVQAQLDDPLSPLLKKAGVIGTLKLLTTGNVENRTLRDHASDIMKSTNEFPPAKSLLPAFEESGVPTRPFAYARDVTGESTLELIEADRDISTQTAAKISDGEWLSLQAICEE